MQAERTYDVVVVGAGTAGAAAAMHCARAGMSVALLDTRPMEAAGARWANAVAGWTFDEAGVARPEGEELLGAGSVVHLVAGGRRCQTRYQDLLEVDMRLLVARLQQQAVAAGARLFPQVRVDRWDGRVLTTTAGLFTPRWVADASGHAGARLVPWSGRTFAVDLCSAAQQVRTLNDRSGAIDFFAQYGAAEGEAISFVGVAGGYSTLGLRFEGDRVGLLAGSIPTQGRPTGLEMLRAFLRENPWIGDQVLMGGARVIPLGRPNDRLANERLALLGDAAGQVFSAHGSGVGHGLIAARLFAEALAREEKPRAYAVRFQRRYGGMLAGFDLFRRLSQTLTTEEMERMIDAGMLSSATIRFALSLGRALPDAGALLRATAGAVRQARIGARLASVIAKVALLQGLYATYPTDLRRLPAWKRRVRSLC